MKRFFKKERHEEIKVENLIESINAMLEVSEDLDRKYRSSFEGAGYNDNWEVRIA